MKSDDILVLAALGGLAFVLISRMKKAAPAPTTPIYPGVPTAQAVQSGSPYNPNTVAGWLGVAKQAAGLIESFGSFNGKDYVSDIDTAPLVESNSQAAEHDSIWLAGPDWMK